MVYKNVTIYNVYSLYTNDRHWFYTSKMFSVHPPPPQTAMRPGPHRTLVASPLNGVVLVRSTLDSPRNTIYFYINYNTFTSYHHNLRRRNVPIYYDCGFFSFVCGLHDSITDLSEETCVSYHVYGLSEVKFNIASGIVRFLLAWFFFEDPQANKVRFTEIYCV